ncbi:MAG TPA: CHAT domain-containing protein [Gemmatimonadaceae bacterium]|nr:CHAT domain-containing protein [Gemmatimonadaceae bacterium]
MHGSLLAALSPALALALFIPPIAREQDPRAVVLEATRAVQQGTSSALRDRWAADSGSTPSALGLATIYRLTYDYDAAERLYRRIIERAPATDRQAIYARLGLAQAMEAHGRKHGMSELLVESREAARTAGDRTAEAEALFWRAHTLAPVYGGGFALAHLDTALRLLPNEAAGLRAACRCRRAQIMSVMGAPGAPDTLNASGTFARQVGDSDAEAICLRARGTARWIRGANDSAVATYDTLADLRRRMRDRSNLAVALVLKADALRGEGKFGEALKIFRAALVEARASRNLYIDATVTLGTGGTALILNDHATAERLVRRAVAAFDQAGDSASAMLARSFLPFVSFAAGDLDRARQEVQAVLPWARQVGDWSHLINVYTQLAAIEMRARQWDAASRALDDASAAARNIGPAGEGTILFPRGRLALYRGDLPAAERAFTAHLAGLDSARRLQRYETRAHLADVYARRGDLERAERELRNASDELDAWRARLDDRELRTLVFQSGATEANDRNASVARVIGALAAGGRADAAFALAERRRARELAERITRARALRESDAGSGPNGNGQPDATRPTAFVNAADITAAIPDDKTALLEYVTGVMGAPTTLFVLTRRTTPDSPAVRAYVLPSADSLVGHIARFVALMESGGDADELASRLAASVLAPATNALPASVTRLIIVPDGPLHRVPWDALRLPDNRYVAERFSVGVTPSVAVLADLWRRGREPSGAGARDSGVRLLAYGDPALPNERDPRDSATPEMDTYRTAFDSAGGLPRLRASAREARLVARYASDAQVRLREEASASSLKRTPLSDFDVLHFATHALVDDRSMTRSALALAPGDGESGFVGPGDLATLALDAALVVLSACRSAGGVVVDGEGVQGLTAPLLEAGARSVVATQWRIGDRSTVDFVDEFYRELSRGRPVVDALREAKAQAIRRGVPAREWAAFIAVGDPLVMIPLRSPPMADRRWTIVALAVLVLGLAAYGLWIRKRRMAEAR